MWKDYIHVFLNFPSPKNIHYNLFGHPFKHYYNILSPYNIHTVKPGNIKFILVTGKNQLYIKSTLYQGSKYSENYYNVGFGYRPKKNFISRFYVILRDIISRFHCTDKAQRIYINYTKNACGQFKIPKWTQKYSCNRDK